MNEHVQSSACTVQLVKNLAPLATLRCNSNAAVTLLMDRSLPATWYRHTITNEVSGFGQGLRAGAGASYSCIAMYMYDDMFVARRNQHFGRVGFLIAWALTFLQRSSELLPSTRAPLSSTREARAFNVDDAYRCRRACADSTARCACGDGNRSRRSSIGCGHRGYGRCGGHRGRGG